MKKKTKTLLEGCALCGSPVELHAGMRRCSNKECGHIHDVSYAFHQPYERVHQSKYPEYIPIIPKSVDEEMK